MKIPSFLKSFQYALRGLEFVYTHERNFRIECFFTGLVVLSFFLLPLSRLEIIVLIFLCGLVLALEIVNTVAEHFLDLLKPRLSYHIQVVKDILAGLVFLSVLIALVVGMIIYLPAFIEFFRLFMIQ